MGLAAVEQSAEAPRDVVLDEHAGHQRPRPVDQPGHPVLQPRVLPERGVEQAGLFVEERPGDHRGVQAAGREQGLELGLEGGAAAGLERVQGVLGQTRQVGQDQEPEPVGRRQHAGGQRRPPHAHRVEAQVAQPLQVDLARAGRARAPVPRVGSGVADGPERPRLVVHHHAPEGRSLGRGPRAPVRARHAHAEREALLVDHALPAQQPQGALDQVGRGGAPGPGGGNSAVFEAHLRGAVQIAAMGLAAAVGHLQHHLVAIGGLGVAVQGGAEPEAVVRARSVGGHPEASAPARAAAFDVHAAPDARDVPHDRLQAYQRCRVVGRGLLAAHHQRGVDLGPVGAVRAGAERGRELDLEGGVAPVVLAHLHAVQPDRRVPVDALEDGEDRPVRPPVDPEACPVPEHARGLGGPGVAPREGSGSFGRVGHLDARREGRGVSRSGGPTGGEPGVLRIGREVPRAVEREEAGAGGRWRRVPRRDLEQRGDLGLVGRGVDHVDGVGVGPAPRERERHQDGDRRAVHGLAGPSRPARKAASARKAWPRWLMAFFSSRPYSARCLPSGRTNTGS